MLTQDAGTGKNDTTKSKSGAVFPDDMTPASIVFWRHFIALFGAMVLLGSKPLWPYGLANGIATHVGALLWALALSGLAYLFFTTKMKGKYWKVFIQFAWFIAVAVILKNLGLT